MFGCVAAADPNGPVAVAHADNVTVAHRDMADRHVSDDARKITPTLRLHWRNLFRRPASANQLRDGLDRRFGALVGNQHPGKEILGSVHPQRDTMFTTEPPCAAEVIGVEMRDQYPGHRAARQRFNPGLLRRIEQEPGVNHCDAASVLKQPDIDMPQ